MRNICGIRRVDRVRDKITRIERNVLKWFGHVEKMGDEKLANRVYRANVEGNKGRRTPQRRWRDELKDLLREG